MTEMISRPRIIPVLLIENRKLIKTIRFKKKIYIGDPVNAVKIFNDKEVDEMIVLDIGASKNNRTPDMDYIGMLAGECFMPLCYGGGVSSVQDIRAICSCGIEKVIINSAIWSQPEFIQEACMNFGKSTIILSLDIKKNFTGQHKIFDYVTGKTRNRSLPEAVKELEEYGAGEIMINAVDRDGMQQGYDLDLVKLISEQVSVPVIACGGAGCNNDFTAVIKAGASAAAAGSRFVFHGSQKAVLINYIEEKEIENIRKAVDEVD